MKQPPKMLTPKDCLYLEDLMNVTLTFSKKAKHYSSLAEKKQIQDMLQATERKFSTHYEKLLSIIGG